jgi:uncharacterized membrane protein
MEPFGHKLGVAKNYKLNKQIMNLLPLMIGPFEIITTLAIVISLFFSSLFLISKYERGKTYFIWLLLIIFLPILGSLSYLIKHLINLPNNKRAESINNVA